MSRVVIKNYSATDEAFKPGDVIKDHCGVIYGVLDIESADGNMSRYTLHCFSNGAEYSNMPHYTMTLVESYENIKKRNAERNA